MRRFFLSADGMRADGFQLGVKEGKCSIVLNFITLLSYYITFWAKSQDLYFIL